MLITDFINKNEHFCIPQKKCVALFNLYNKTFHMYDDQRHFSRFLQENDTTVARMRMKLDR